MFFEVLQQSTLTNDAAALRHFLASQLVDEEYALVIRQVHELRDVDHVTRIANAPAYIKGVPNLRGVIGPLLDLRIKLNMEVREYDSSTVVIVLNSRARTIGAAADSASEAVTLEPNQVKPPLQLGASIDTDYLLGLGTIEEQMLILVDLGRLTTDADFNHYNLLHRAGLERQVRKAIDTLIFVRIWGIP